MLPLGRKNARKCSECGITCHANCAHLVPDFCGMSMETANQLLAEIQKVKSSRTAGGRPPQPTRPQKAPMHMEHITPQPGYMQPPSEPQPQMDGLRTSVDNMRLGMDQQQQMEYYGRQTPGQQPPDRFESHYVTQPLPPGKLTYPYPPEGPSPSVPPIPPGALPPGARVPAPMPYAEPPIHPASGRPSYDRPGPPAQEPYGYQVSCDSDLACMFRWSLTVVSDHSRVYLHSSSSSHLSPSGQSQGPRLVGCVYHRVRLRTGRHPSRRRCSSNNSICKPRDGRGPSVKSGWMTSTSWQCWVKATLARSCWRRRRRRVSCGLSRY